MNRISRILACLIMGAVPVATSVVFVAEIAVTSGCAGQSAIKTYSYTQDAFINAGGKVVTLRQVGKINDQDYNTVVLPLMREIDAALDQWDAAITRKDPNASNFATITTAALNRLTAYLVSRQGGHQ